MSAIPLNIARFALGEAQVKIEINRQLYVVAGTYVNPYPVTFTLQVVAPDRGERYNFQLKPTAPGVIGKIDGIVNLHAYDVFGRVVYSRVQ